MLVWIQDMNWYRSHGVSNHWQLYYFHFFVLTIENKPLHDWSFMKGIYRWSIDSPYKGPVTRKAFPCFDISLTLWGRVTHICVNKITIIGSDNGLSPGRRQAIIWTDAGILLVGPLGTNFSEILIEILTFSFKKMHLKMSSGKWRPFCLGLNVLKDSDAKPKTSFIPTN